MTFEPATLRTPDTARRILASSVGLITPARLDLLIHALAQLPDEVTLEACINGHDRSRLELLAEAYGIEDRVAFCDTPHEDDAALAELLNSAPTLAELVEAFSKRDDIPAARRYKDDIFESERIGVVTNVPTHYRVPLFNDISRRLTAAGASFRVFFLADAPASRPWMRPEPAVFDHEYVRSFDLQRDRGRRLIPIDLEARIDRFAPTVLLAAGFSPAASVRVARYASRRNQTVFGLWSGEIATRATAQSRLRRIQRRRLAHKASFAIAYGARSAEYLRELRPDLPLVIGRNTTIVPRVIRRRPRPKTIELLTVARAERGKSLHRLIDAVLAVRDLPCRLTVVGDGAELPSLVARAGGDDRIRFAGAVPSDRLPQFYEEADVFLFPSRFDIFGLVLVEAMGSGLATIVSRSPGAVADLALDGQNCIVVDGHRPEAWADAIRRVVVNHELRLALGESAERTIRNRWTIEHACDAMIAGFRLGVLCRTARQR